MVKTIRHAYASAVGIAAGYGLNGLEVEVRVPVGSEFLFTLFIPALGYTQPPI
jgi:hypothetical protein